MQPKISWPRLLGVTKSVFWAPGTLKTAAPGPRAARARTTRRLFFGSSGAPAALQRWGPQEGEAAGPPGAGRAGDAREEGGQRGEGRPGAPAHAGVTLWSPAPAFLLPFLLFSGSHAFVPGAGIRLSRLCPYPEICCCTIVYSGIAKNWKQHFYQWGSI